MHTVFWLERRLWGLDPLGYHLTNVLLHAGTAVLFWLVLGELGVYGAWLAAAVFALHPLEAESVAWVTELKNVLSGVFFLASLLACLRYAGVREGPASGAAGSRRVWGLALLLYALALLAKTAVSPLPMAIAVLLWWKKDRLGRGDLLPLAPFFALGGAAGLATAWLEKSHVGAQGPAFDAGLAQRVIVAGKALWFYPEKLLWPLTSAFVYPQWHPDAGDWLSYIPFAGALAIVAALWLARGKTGKAPLAALLWYGIMIFPALGFFNLYFMRYSHVQNHFQYAAGLGLIALAVALPTAAWQKWTRARRPDTGAIVAAGPLLTAAAVLLALGTLTWRQAGAYQDTETLWRDSLARNPDAWLARSNLCLLLAQRGLLAEAIAHCEQAVRLEPTYAEGHNNLGLALAKSGKLDEAQDRFVRAIRLDPRNDGALVNLGNVFAERGMPEQAITQYETALRIDPTNQVTENNLGVQYARLGRPEAAVEHYRAALRLGAGYVDAHLNLAHALESLGRPDQAAAEYREALRLSSRPK